MPDHRIVHLVPALFGTHGVFGGAERYALELARAMANEVPTELVTFGPEDGTESQGALAVRVLGHPRFVRGQKNNPISTKLFAALRAASTVHCHQQHVLASSLAALYCRFSGRRVFVSDLGGGGWDISSYLPTDRWYHGHLHISEYSRRVCGHSDNNRAHVILGGVDTEKFSPDRAVSRTDEVLYVGRILPHKGINYLVDALPNDLRLTIIGKPEDQRFLNDLREAAEGKRVLFRHDVGDDELVRAYRSALCIVLPSVYHTVYGQKTVVPELLGQTLIEGMATGTPGLCTEIASLPEVVEDGVSGFIVPPNDPGALRAKLIWLRDNPKEVELLGEAALKRVLERFTWKAVVARCLEAYGT
jgi:glycosyltransferase involved in cell wall biosynthesis